MVDLDGQLQNLISPNFDVAESYLVYLVLYLSLVQVLREAQHTHPYMDIYHHKRDQSLLVALSSPFNEQLLRKEEWHAWLHSNCGFRNYLEHVAQFIDEWVQHEEAKYQAELLAREVEEMHKEEQDDASAPTSAKDKRKSRSKSPKKSASKDFLDKLRNLPQLRNENCFQCSGTLGAFSILCGCYTCAFFHRKCRHVFITCLFNYRSGKLCRQQQHGTITERQHVRARRHSQSDEGRIGASTRGGGGKRKSHG